MELAALGRAAAPSAERDHCARHIERREHFSHRAMTSRDFRQLVLVDDQHVDEREQRRRQCCRRRGVQQHFDAAVARSSCERRDGFERSFELQQEVADAVEGRQIRSTQHRVGARRDGDRVLRVVGEADQSHAAGGLGNPDDVQLHAGVAQRSFHQWSKCILAQGQHHPCLAAARACAGDGLVRAFAARNDCELAAKHGLAGRGHMMRPHDEVQIGRSRDQDRITHQKSILYVSDTVRPRPAK